MRPQLPGGVKGSCEVEEDLVILDRKIFQAQPRLSEADGPIVEFRKWAKQFYLEGDPRAVNR